MLRLATELDFPVFSRLWMSFLEEQFSNGDPLIPTARTMQFFTTLFRAYVSGARKGFILLYDDVGTLVCGEDLTEQPCDSFFGPWAQVFGAYVDPGRRREGISHSMYKMAIGMAKTLGFKTLLAGVLVDNDPGIKSITSEGFHAVGGTYARILSKGTE